MTPDESGNPLEIGAGALRVRDVVAVARGGRQVRLASSALPAIERSRAVVTAAVEARRAVYGVTTGFGALKDVSIPRQDQADLQIHLLRSHAAGTGGALPADAVRAAMLLRAHTLAQGYSGVRPILIQRILDLLNAGLIPVVPAQGSVGASGDLAPLAHLALPLVGEGHVCVRDEIMPSREALASAGIEPLTLEAKEALALTNGTQIIAALAALALYNANRLVRAAEIAAAMSFEALDGNATAFLPAIHQLRPHPGQVAVAARMRALLERDGRPPGWPPRNLQDPYSLRCIPQVLGAVRNALGYARQTMQIEINAVTDNPLCLPDTGEVISGGNFHGHPLALMCDSLKIAITSLGAFTERRIASLVDERSSGLPAFLTPNPGLNSGFMIAQYTAASLASENKVLAHPASVDSIPTSADVEDYNSMATTAARHLADVVANTTAIVAIELVCAAQALDLRRRAPWATGVEAGYRAVRAVVPFLNEDAGPLHELIDAAVSLVRSGDLQRAVDDAIQAGDEPAPDETGGGSQ